MFHSELVNLLRTLGLDATRPPSEEAWQQLLGDLSRSYTEAERVRFLMKRSFAFSSREMRQLNASLAAERDEFAQIFRAAPVGMARVELDGHVSVVNTAMATIVGMRARRAVRAPDGELRSRAGRDRDRSDAHRADQRTKKRSQR